jgi:hypothetical protein
MAPDVPNNTNSTGFWTRSIPCEFCVELPYAGVDVVADEAHTEFVQGFHGLVVEEAARFGACRVNGDAYFLFGAQLAFNVVKSSF